MELFHQVLVDIERLVGMGFALVAHCALLRDADAPVALATVWVHTGAMALQLSVAAHQRFDAKPGNA